MTRTANTPLDRWTDTQAEQHDDGCRCVHAAEADDESPISQDPAMQRYAEAIAQRG